MTTEELAGKIKEIFTDAGQVKVSLQGDQVKMDISAMYSAPGRSLPLLLKLSEVLGTTDINEDDTYAWGGCDTCDFGSKYGVMLVAPNVDGRITND